MPQWPKHSSSVYVKDWCSPPASKGSAGTVWPCHTGSLRECFKCINWVVFPPAWDTWWTHWHENITHSTSLCVKICVSLQRLTVNCSFWDQGPEEAECWRPHQGLKKGETSLSPHYATTLSLRFRLFVASFVLVHGKTLWDFKRKEAIFIWKLKKTHKIHAFLSFSVFVFHSKIHIVALKQN